MSDLDLIYGQKKHAPEKTSPEEKPKPKSLNASPPTPKMKTKLTTDMNTSDHHEKPEKYTTHLEASLVKQLKLFAVEKDLKDYQVIKNALVLYFEKNR